MSHTCDRRKFLTSTLAGLAAGAAGLPIRLRAAGSGAREIECLHYKRITPSTIRCELCPKWCVLNEGERCFCRTRYNRGGKLYTDAYSVPAFIHFDPVEKGPLNHVLPGARAMALGTGGCNLRCLYCQNWQVSQNKPLDVPHQEYTPADLVKALEGSSKAKVVAFTYSEPVVFYEYMREIALEAKSRGFVTNMVTAGYINPAPVREACQWIDAFSVSLKGFEDAFYQKVLASELKPVLETLTTIRASGKWLEIVTLLVPGYNDSPEVLGKLTTWVARELGPDTPLHFGRFWPAYKLVNLPETPIQSLDRAIRIARDAGLRYVYLASIPGGHPAQNTTCPRCSRELVRRVGFTVKENSMGPGGLCPCGEKIPGRWT